MLFLQYQKPQNKNISFHKGSRRTLGQLRDERAVILYRECFKNGVFWENREIRQIREEILMIGDREKEDIIVQRLV